MFVCLSGPFVFFLAPPPPHPPVIPPSVIRHPSSRESGDLSKAKDCLPDKSKQFLVTRNGKRQKMKERRTDRGAR